MILLYQLRTKLSKTQSINKKMKTKNLKKNRILEKIEEISNLSTSMNNKISVRLNQYPLILSNWFHSRLKTMKYGFRINQIRMIIILKKATFMEIKTKNAHKTLRSRNISKERRKIKESQIKIYKS